MQSKKCWTKFRFISTLTVNSTILLHPIKPWQCWKIFWTTRNNVGRKHCSRLLDCRHMLICCVSHYRIYTCSLASAIDDIQEEEESNYVDRLREYYLYADAIRYFSNRKLFIKLGPTALTFAWKERNMALELASHRNSPSQFIAAR